MSVHHPVLLEHSAPERNYEPLLLAAIVAITAVLLVSIGILMVMTG